MEPMAEGVLQRVRQDGPLGAGHQGPDPHEVRGALNRPSRVQTLRHCSVAAVSSLST